MPSLSCVSFSVKSGRTLAFGVLGRAAGPLEAVFLAFFDAGIPGDEAGPAQRDFHGLIGNHQCASDAVADGLGLSVNPAANDLNDNLESVGWM